MLAIMAEYGWDYQTYLRQPSWLLDLATRKMDVEGKAAKRAADNNHA